jgi:hypothetical protein
MNRYMTSERGKASMIFGRACLSRAVLRPSCPVRVAREHWHSAVRIGAPDREVSHDSPPVASAECIYPYSLIQLERGLRAYCHESCIVEYVFSLSRTPTALRSFLPLDAAKRATLCKDMEFHIGAQEMGVEGLPGRVEAELKPRSKAICYCSNRWGSMLAGT